MSAVERRLAVWILWRLVWPARLRNWAYDRLEALGIITPRWINREIAAFYAESLRAVSFSRPYGENLGVKVGDAASYRLPPEWHVPSWADRDTLVALDVPAPKVRS